MTGIQKQKVEYLINSRNYEFFYQGENAIKLRKQKEKNTKIALVDNLGRITYIR